MRPKKKHMHRMGRRRRTPPLYATWPLASLFLLFAVCPAASSPDREPDYAELKEAAFVGGHVFVLSVELRLTRGLADVGRLLSERTMDAVQLAVCEAASSPLQDVQVDSSSVRSRVFGELQLQGGPAVATALADASVLKQLAASISALTGGEVDRTRLWLADPQAAVLQLDATLSREPAGQPAALASALVKEALEGGALQAALSALGLVVSSTAFNASAVEQHAEAEVVVAAPSMAAAH